MNSYSVLFNTFLEIKLNKIVSLELLYMFNANSLPLLKIYFELDDNCKIEHIEHINNEYQLVLLGICNLYIF